MLSIAQRLTKPVEIAAGGRQWRVVFTHRVLLDIEELTGLDAMRLNLVRPSALLLRAVLCAALREAGATISLDEAGAMLRPGPAVGIRTALIDAWQASMPLPEPEDQTPVSKKDAEPLTTLQAWCMARYDLRLSDEEWLAMTPRMLHGLSQQRLETIRWSELMMGVLCAHTVNHSFCAPKKPTSPRSYMFHPWPEREEIYGPVYGEDIMAAFAGIPKSRVN